MLVAGSSVGSGGELEPRFVAGDARDQLRKVVAGALYPCAGVYAVAAATGTVRKHDSVSVT